MKTLIVLVLIGNGLRIIKSIVYLAMNVYPRTSTYQPWEDVLDLVVGIAVVLWMVDLVGHIQ